MAFLAKDFILHTLCFPNQKLYEKRASFPLGKEFTISLWRGHSPLGSFWSSCLKRDRKSSSLCRFGVWCSRKVWGSKPLSNFDTAIYLNSTLEFGLDGSSSISARYQFAATFQYTQHSIILKAEILRWILGWRAFLLSLILIQAVRALSIIVKTGRTECGFLWEWYSFLQGSGDHPSLQESSNCPIT